MVKIADFQEVFRDCQTTNVSKFLEMQLRIPQHTTKAKKRKQLQDVFVSQESRTNQRSTMRQMRQK